MAARPGMISSQFIPIQYIHKIRMSVYWWKGRASEQWLTNTTKYNIKSTAARIHTNAASSWLQLPWLTLCLFVRREQSSCVNYYGSHCENKCHVDDIPFLFCLIFDHIFGLFVCFVVVFSVQKFKIKNRHQVFCDFKEREKKCVEFKSKKMKI